MSSTPFSMQWTTLLIPILFVVCGISVIIAAVIGSPKYYENSKDLKMQNQIARWGKNKARLVHGLVGAGMLAFGGYLLYCALFGPIIR